MKDAKYEHVSMFIKSWGWGENNKLGCYGLLSMGLWVYGLWTIWTIELRRVTLTMVMMTVLRRLLGDYEK